jgi:[ribosomal protein S5]-alanine N-acetyltransferase
MELVFGEYRIRSYRPEDLERLLQYAGNREVSISLRDRFPHPYTREDGEKWLRLVAEQSPELNFAIASDRGLIGGIGLELRDDVETGSAEVGYWLGTPFWGRGIATAALRAFIPWTFSELDLVRLCAWVFESNPASARVLEKCGFTLEGRFRRAAVKDGRRMDMLVYGLLRDEIEA